MSHIFNDENVIKKRFAYILLSGRVLVNKMIAKTQLKMLVQCQSLLFLNQDAPYCFLSTFRVIGRRNRLRMQWHRMGLNGVSGRLPTCSLFAVLP